MLGQGDHVHVAFDHQNPFQVGGVFWRLVKAVEFPAFLENRGLRRVQVLGLVVTQHPATEGDHPAALVADGEHNAIAEAIVDASVVVFHQHSALLKQFAPAARPCPVR